MNPIEWLEQNATGFSELTTQEREAITHFALLWSFWEHVVFKHLVGSTGDIASASPTNNFINVRGFLCIQ